jgi:hypothetical protein
MLNETLMNCGDCIVSPKGIIFSTFKLTALTGLQWALLHQPYLRISKMYYYEIASGDAGACNLTETAGLTVHQKALEF